MIDVHARLRCDLEPLSNGNFRAAFFSTIGLVAFAIWLECISHKSIDCCTTISDDVNVDDDIAGTTSDILLSAVEQQPRPHAAPAMDGSQNSGNDQDPEATRPNKPEPSRCFDSLVSPNIRANRLIAAIFIYAVVLFLFIIRMRDINVPHLRSECRPYTSLHLVKSRMPKPNWWFVTLLNILPFICASFSLLRTFVDCILVRWGHGLSYGDLKKSNAWTWPPCLPVFAVWFVFFMTVKVLAFPIAWVMGRPASSTWAHAIPRTGAERSGDTEMQGEEARRLIDNVDGELHEDEERLNGPPAYEEAVHQKESEMKGNA